MTGLLVACDRPEEGVLRITLDRPQVHNAISLAVQREIDETMAAAEIDDDVRVVVLASTGDRAFSAGYDITEMASMEADEFSAANVEREQMLWRYFTFRKPTVAALSGAAHGAGTLYALCSDIRVGGPTTSLTVTAAKYGGANLTWLLDSVLGAGYTRDLLMTARTVSAAEALAIGMVTRDADDGDVDGMAVRVAVELAARSPEAVQEIKALLTHGPGRTLRERFEDEIEVGRTTLRPGPVSTTFAPFLVSGTR